MRHDVRSLACPYSGAMPGAGLGIGKCQITLIQVKVRSLRGVKNVAPVTVSLLPYTGRKVHGRNSPPSSGPASAQTYPTRAVRIIVPFAPGRPDGRHRTHSRAEIVPAAWTTVLGRDLPGAAGRTLWIASEPITLDRMGEGHRRSKYRGRVMGHTRPWSMTTRVSGGADANR